MTLLPWISVNICVLCEKYYTHTQYQLPVCSFPCDKRIKKLKEEKLGKRSSESRKVIKETREKQKKSGRKESVKEER